MMTRLVCTISIAVVLLVSQVGAQSKPITLRVGYLPATHDTLLFLALDAHLFPDRIVVQAEKYSNSPEILQHLSANDIDLGIPGIATPARYISTGSPLLIVGGAATKSAALVVRPELAGSFQRNSGGKLSTQDINKIFETLKSRRVGTTIGSTGDAIFRAEVAKRGLTRSILIQTKASPSEIITELQAGSLDAGVLWSPHMTRAENLGMPIILWTDQLLEEHVCCRMVSTTAFAEMHPDALSDYLAGILRAYKMFRTSRDRKMILDIVDRYLSPKLEPNDLTKELFGDGNARPRTSLSPDIYEKGVADYVTRMQNAEILTTGQGQRVNQSIKANYQSKAYQVAFGLSASQAMKCARDGYLSCVNVIEH